LLHLLATLLPIVTASDLFRNKGAPKVALWVAGLSVLPWMASATGHHWVTHGIFNLIVFVGLGWALSKLDNGQGLKISANALVIAIVSAAVVSELIITGFYL